LSWNVEAFDGSEVQLKNVAEHINNLQPDVFGLFEVENIDNQIAGPKRPVSEAEEIEIKKFISTISDQCSLYCEIVK